MAGIVDHFRTNMGIDVRLAQPAFEGEAGEGQQRVTSSHATAAGLSMFAN
jgi:hypothetical protein